MHWWVLLSKSNHSLTLYFINILLINYCFAKNLNQLQTLYLYWKRTYMLYMWYMLYMLYIVTLWESIQEWTSKTCGRQSSCLSRPYPSKFFKGCLPQILLGPFLNTLSHIWKQFLIEKKVIKKSITICRGIFWYVSITCFAAIIWNI